MPSEPLPPFGAIALPEAPRARSRKILLALKISLPFIGILFLLGALLLLLQLFSWNGSKAYEAEEYDKAGASYKTQAKLAFPAPWVAEYNTATALVAKGSIEESLGWFDEAIAHVPKASPDEEGMIQAFTYECTVRMNASAAYEMLGDREKDAAETDSADAFYVKAQEWVQPCLPPSNGQGGNPPSEGGDPEGGDPEGGDPSGGDPSGGGDPEGGDPEGGQPGGQGQGKGDDGDEGDKKDSPGATGDRLDEKRKDLQGGGEGKDKGKDKGQGRGQGKTGDGDGDGPDGEEDGKNPFVGESDGEKDRREQLQDQKKRQAERQRERDEYQNRDYSPKGW